MNYTTIIASYGNQATLDQTLLCARKQLFDAKKIIVGDASPESNKACQYACEWNGAQYHHTGRTGFAHNVNTILRQCESDYALLLGADVAMPADVTIRLWAGKGTNANRITQAQVIDPSPVHRKRPEVNAFTNCLAGNCTLIPLKFQREHAIWFDERLWSYGEDTQFGFDWLKAGGTIWQSDVMAIHNPNGYFATHKEGHKYYYLTRNSLHLARRYAGWRIQGVLIALGLLMLKPSSDVVKGFRDFLRGTYGPLPAHKNPFSETL